MNILLSFLAISFSFCLFSQQSVTTETISIPEDVSQSTNWTTYAETPELKIEYFIADCYPNSGLDFQSVFLRMTNLTGNSIELSWHFDLEFGKVCTTCDTYEFDRMITLEPNEVVEGSCENKTEKTLEIFSKFIDPAYTKGARLSAFGLSAFTITL
jgi:hypothetical protein